MLDYTVRHPTKFISGDPNMPQGKARNVASTGDGTGTPWEEDLINDLVLSPAQALLKAAGITPSGSVDHANASDFLDALRIVARPEPRVMQAGLAFSSIGDGIKLGIGSPSINKTGFSVSSSVVTVPEAGWYRVSISCQAVHSSSTNPTYVDIKAYANAALIPGGQVEGARHSSAGYKIMLAGSFAWHCTDPATEKLSLINDSGSGTISDAGDPSGNIIKITQIGRGE